MISVTEARRIVSENLIQFDIREVGFMEAEGSVLAENIEADRDFPPFDRVTMDGIAIDSTTLNNGLKEFQISHMQPAGAIKSTLSDSSGAVEIMTGAVLPENTDAVIRYEDLEITENENGRMAKVLLDSIEPNKNVHRRAEDKKTGDALISTGVLIGSTEIAVLATTGNSKVKVYSLPKTAIISTGDELVDVDQSPQDHQIRKSNIYAIRNELNNLGVQADLFHIADEKEEIESRLTAILRDYPIVILSGGVSKGKLDFIPGILEKMGIEKKFHVVSQRPGKPLWFGASKENVVFALPGNPVSTYMCFMIYVKSWFLQCLNLTSMPEYATLDSDASFTPNLTYFLQVKVYFDEDSKLMATPVIGHGSGDLTNLLQADGFMELPSGQTLFNRGTSFPIYLFRRNKVISKSKP